MSDEPSVTVQLDNARTAYRHLVRMVCAAGAGDRITLTGQDDGPLGWVGLVTAVEYALSKHAAEAKHWKDEAANLKEDLRKAKIAAYELQSRNNKLRDNASLAEVLDSIISKKVRQAFAAAAEDPNAD